MRSNGHSRQPKQNGASDERLISLVEAKMRPRPILYSFYRVVKGEKRIGLIQEGKRPRFRGDLVNHNGNRD